HGHREGTQSSSGENTLLCSRGRRHQGRDPRLEEEARSKGLTGNNGNRDYRQSRRRSSSHDAEGRRQRRRSACRCEGRGLLRPFLYLTFENQARTGDKVFAREDVKLFCDLKSYIYLNGTVLD